MKARLDNFGGLVLMKDPKKGPFWTALEATNCDVQKGSIDVTYGVDPASVQVAFTPTTPLSCFNIQGSDFCMWAADVDADFAPIADNSSKRLLFTGDGVPKVTDWGFATLNHAPPFPQIFFTLGLPIPVNFKKASAAGAVLAVTGGAAPTEARAYVYTNVSPWGEESAPCDAVQVTGNSTGGTWRLRYIGALSGRYDANGLPLGCAVTAVTWATGVLSVTVSTTDVKQFRVGDLVYLETTAGGVNDMCRVAHPIATINTGTGVMTCNWGGPTTTGVNAWRVGPINSYNITNAVKNTPAAGKVKISVDVVHGLRVGDRVGFDSVAGMTDLNTFGFLNWATIEQIISTPTDTSVVISLVTAQTYTGGGSMIREAPYLTNALICTGATWAGGIAQIATDFRCSKPIQGVAHIAVGDQVLLLGFQGATQLNGLRTVTSVDTGIALSVSLPSGMSAYTAGGTMILGSPVPFVEYTLSSVSYLASVFTFVISQPHDFAVGDYFIAYDVGGMTQANNEFIVATVVGNTITASTSYGAASAYTSGGKLVKINHQVKKRVYRTNTTDLGAADFQLVAEIGNQKCDLSDTTEDANLSDTILPSETWIAPPTDMKGMVVHPHGFPVGFSKNILCLGEPYMAHAWPLAYQQVLPADIVAVKLYGSTIIALTADRPYRFTGVHPSAITKERVEIGEPCTSKRSACSTGLGVAYRGRSGIYILGDGGSNNATFNYLPASMFDNPSDTPMRWWRNRLVWIDSGQHAGYIFNPMLEEKGLTQFDLGLDRFDAGAPSPAFGLHVSPVDGRLYGCLRDGGVGDTIGGLFTVQGVPTRFTYKSQYIYFPKPISLGAMQVDWDWQYQSAQMKAREDTIKANFRLRAGRDAAVNDHDADGVTLGGDDLVNLYQPDTSTLNAAEQYLKVTVLANPGKDNQTIVFDDFVVDSEVVRLLDGIESDTYQVNLVGNALVTAVSLAEEIEELAQL